MTIMTPSDSSPNHDSCASISTTHGLVLLYFLIQALCLSLIIFTQYWTVFA